MFSHRAVFAGIGLRESQFDAALSTCPDVGFIEVAAEGCLGESPALWRLARRSVAA